MTHATRRLTHQRLNLMKATVTEPDAAVRLGLALKQAASDAQSYFAFVVDSLKPAERSGWSGQQSDQPRVSSPSGLAKTLLKSQYDRRYWTDGSRRHAQAY